jgi:hypothetical protein
MDHSTRKGCRGRGWVESNKMWKKEEKKKTKKEEKNS